MKLNEKLETLHLIHGGHFTSTDYKEDYDERRLSSKCDVCGKLYEEWRNYEDELMWTIVQYGEKISLIHKNGLIYRSNVFI